ncbi:MAG: hypothetical protein HC817_13405 [Saprospiraceae bacterium]|nr:hypothetical protein [Saprospiraceae bacterium]
MLSFQYPIWYFLFCALLGAAFVAILYFKDTTFKNQSVWLTRSLMMLRWLSGTLISALLLSPILKSVETDIKKPVVVIAQDASESIAAAALDTPQYRANFEALSAALGDKYEVRTYNFGEKVREGIDFQYKDKITNISDLMKNVYDLYSNQNLGAVVVATDGIYNEGSNPVYAAAKLNAPIYTIALGDTTPKKDVLIKKVFHNNIAYLGDKFNIQVDIAANNCAGASSVLTVSRLNESGQMASVSTQSFVIGKKDFFFTKEITLDATQVGTQRFRVSVSPINGEASTINNTKDIFIEVLDARTKILLLANAPHPDIAAFNEAISINKNYAVVSATIGDPRVNAADFDFVILHQLPSTTNGADAVLNILNNKKTPRLYVVGSQSDTRKLTAGQSLMSLSTDGKNTSDVQAVLNPNFNLFTLENGYEQFATFNPLAAPFGDFAPSAVVKCLCINASEKLKQNIPSSFWANRMAQKQVLSPPKASGNGVYSILHSMKIMI